MDFNTLVDLVLVYWGANVVFGAAMLSSKTVRGWVAKATAWVK